MRDFGVEGRILLKWIVKLLATLTTSGQDMVAEFYEKVANITQ
jgi:hypothetical protein